LEEELQIRLLDLQGRLLKQYRFTGFVDNNLRLDLPADLPNGLYFLDLRQGEKRERFRVVKSAQ
jgi:hypothetical protein